MQETRDEISDSAEELLRKAKEQYETAHNKIEKLACRKKEIYIGKKEGLIKALKAGVEAFKQ